MYYANSTMHYLFILALFLTLNCLNAKENSSNYRYTVKQAIHRALEYHEAIKQAETDKQISSTLLFKSKANMLPSLNASYNRARFQKNGRLSTEDSHFPKGWTEQYELSVSQPIFTFGKLYSNMKIAKEAIKAKNLQLEASKDGLIYLTKVLYYSTLFSKQNYEIINESYKNTLNNQKDLMKRARSGRISNADQIKMQSDIAQREPLLKQAEVQYTNNLNSLKEHLRLSKEAQLELRDNFNYSLTKRLNAIKISDAIQNNSQLQMLKTATEIERLKTKIATAAFAPDIAGFFQFSAARGDTDLNFSDANWKRETYCGVQLKLNFGGSKIADYKEAILNKQKSELAYKQQKSTLKDKINNLRNSYVSMFEIYNDAIKSEKLTQQTYNVTKALFQSGKLSQTYLNDRELQLMQARLKVAETIYNLFILHAEIEKEMSLGS